MESKKDQQYQKNDNNSVTLRPAPLLLRKRVRRADARRGGQFRAALTTALLESGIAACPSPEAIRRAAWEKNGGSWADKNRRLEKRPWWPAYLEWRAARIEAAEKAIRERSDAALRAAIQRATAPEAAQKVSDCETFEPPRSLTLRERFLAKAANA